MARRRGAYNVGCIFQHPVHELHAAGERSGDRDRKKEKEREGGKEGERREEARNRESELSLS